MLLAKGLLGAKNSWLLLEVCCFGCYVVCLVCMEYSGSLGQQGIIEVSLG